MKISLTFDNVRTANKEDTVAEARKKKNMRNVVTALAMVVACYAICNTVKSIEYLRYNLGANLDFMSAYYQFISVLQLSNCCVNPFVYTFQYAAYKRQAKHLFRCHRQKGPEEISHTSAGA